MIDDGSVPRHCPEWLEHLAEMMRATDPIYDDGIAYALEWAATDIRLLEKRVSTAIDVSANTISGLKVELRRMDEEIIRLRSAIHNPAAYNPIEEGAWS